MTVADVNICMFEFMARADVSANGMQCYVSGLNYTAKRTCIVFEGGCLEKAQSKEGDHVDRILRVGNVERYTGCLAGDTDGGLKSSLRQQRADKIGCHLEIERLHMRSHAC